MRLSVVLVSLTLVGLVLAGCIQEDPVPDSDGGNRADERGVRVMPEFALPDAITGFDPVGKLDSGGAQGVWVMDAVAYLSGGEGLRIYDIADPADPILLAEDVEDTQGSRDVEVFVHPVNNRTYAVLGDNSNVMTFVDVTDPREPVVSAKVEGVGSTHNIAVVPGTAVVYNSRSISTHTPALGSSGQTDIVDFTDPDDPVVHVYDFPALAITEGGLPRVVTATTCHDVTFNEELARAYCAGVTQTLIWDVSDPVAPEVLQVVDWPLTNIHHGAWDARGGDILILGDEFAGVLAPTPMCHDVVEYPSSALWFFDISDLSMPVPLGYFQIGWDALGASLDAGAPIYCSTHFGSVVEDRDLFALGWYSAGTALVDFSDPTDPVMVDHFRPEGGMSTWDAYYYNGHVFTGDTARGMDILRLVD